MTSKRYRESKKMSRSRSQHRTAADRTRNPRSQVRLHGPCGYFNACRPEQAPEEHPVDLAVDHLPRVASLRRKLLRLAERWQGEVEDPRAFVAYEDLRLEYLTLREQNYFNAGYHHGLLAGRAQSRDASPEADPALRVFAQQVRVAVTLAKIPQPRIAAALMQLARAIVLGLPRRY